MNWQANRQEAHREGKHTRPQVDCKLCWDTGAFYDAKNYNPTSDTEGLFHRGQHSDCPVCAAFEKGPPEEELEP